MLLYQTQRVINLAETLPKNKYYYNQYGQAVQVKNSDFYDPINAYVF